MKTPKTILATLAAAAVAATPALAQPAPAISYLEVAAVRSQIKPAWEAISRYQFSTSVDHSGTWVQVVVDQAGYGSITATLNGAAGQLIRTENILNGRTVIGFRKFYQFNVRNIQAARFVTTARLLGGRTLTDTLTIR